MGMNINALGQVATTVALDSEYQRILRELRALGIEPAGDKAVDKAKLQAAKEQQKAKNAGTVIMQAVTGTNDTEKAGALSSEDNVKNDNSIQAQNMTGAEQIAKLNKLKILGMY